MLEIQNFKKSFGRKTVHQDISFKVHKGECLGLLGGSGSGKSVILRSLIGLEKADSGRIIIENEDITKYKELDLIPIRKKVAYVFQGGALFDSMNVYENMAYPLKEHTQLSDMEMTKKISDLLLEFGLQGCEDILPANLSGGMQKRVGLARSIILEPDIVLYDEPTAGLDPYNTLKIQEMILRLKNKGVTSILVTHDMPTAFAVCDNIAIIMNGKIMAKGTKSEIQNQSTGIISEFIHGRIN